jgi:very-short-patch-repair endonuclease
MANDQARRFRKAMTRQEVRLWVRLRALRSLGFHFRRQSPILSYVVDFECRRSRLIVEVDGGQHAMNEGLERDASRDAALKSAGYDVLRFWNHEVDRDLDAVVETIHRKLLAANEPHPAAARPPSPGGEG